MGSSVAWEAPCFSGESRHFDMSGLERRKSNDAIKERILDSRGVIMLYPNYKLPISEYEDFIRANLPGDKYG